MGKLTKFFIIIFTTIILLYFSSWYMIGEKCLYESGIKVVIDDGLLKLHTSDDFFIITKYHGKYRNINYNFELSSKTIKTIDNENEAKQLIEIEKTKYEKDKTENFILELNILKNNPFDGEMDIKILPNNHGPMGSNELFLWMFFTWLKVS